MTVGITVNVIALAALLALMLWWGRPPTETTRLRNALRVQPSRGEDFTWHPPDFPPGFDVERLRPDEELRAIVSAIGVDAVQGDWEKSLLVAAHLAERAKTEGPIGGDPVTTYRAIRAGMGYCADFVKVFLVLAHAAGITARQWSFSFDGFGGHGHTVAEIFDRERGRWLLLDVFNNFHIVDAASGEPLGALEYRDALQGRRGLAQRRMNGPGRPGFVHEHKAVEYYLRGVDQWYLTWGNAVSSRYAHPLVRRAGRLSRVLGDLAANVIGAQPHIRIYETADNALAVRRIFALRSRLRLLLAVALLLVLTLAVQLAIVLAR